MNISPTQRREDKGFTLIELMVVVLIIALLLAIAIPTFLGAQNKAKDRSAQSSARNALTNAKTLYADNGTYVDANAANLATSEPSLDFVVAPLPSLDEKTVSVLSTDKDTWYAAVLSDTNTCFYIKDTVAPAGGGTTYAKVTGSSNLLCFASSATPAAGLYTDKW
jgi:type IV pilus assembly protein PilA